MHRMAIVHQGALGDFLLALPAIEGFAARFPGLKIDFLCKPEHFSLISSRPYAGSCTPQDGPALSPFYHEDLWMNSPLPPFLQDRDAILVFGRKSSRILADRLSRRIPRPVHHIQSFPDLGSGSRHVSAFILDQVRRIGWFPPAFHFPAAVVESSHKDAAEIREWLAQGGFGEDNRPILIHPGSGGRRKIWPLARWWSLLHCLHNRRIPVLMSLGPADGELEFFALEARKLGTLAVRDLSLRRLGALLEECRMYIGSDSGVSHLAGLTCIASVVIFGPTDPEVWAPRGPDVRIVRSRWEESEVFAWSPALPPSPPEAWVEEVCRGSGR